MKTIAKVRKIGFSIDTSRREHARTGRTVADSVSENGHKANVLSLLRYQVFRGRSLIPFSLFQFHETSFSS